MKLQKMILVADKISAKDTENKDFLNGIIEYGVPIVGGALLLGAAILGVNVKGTRIPTIKKLKTLSSNPFLLLPILLLTGSNNTKLL
ncbi:MAG: hypothetical protein ACLTY1_15000 [Blautia sp.]